ncbi:E3 ubiquitin- ligase Bre1 isoform X2 [Brachionus plicatilis]|uniref:E3 ubiquitin protein ligase n=1 Tax=Brachionus plicatilis TaxID=10195 RepID=A0A3M7T8J8_BRAPC|nr:E3 ubiquitin- ligase Bre1 isoform X2 [Brachionus plicatilis]
MHSAAVPCPGNGIKRTAANALSSPSPTSSSSSHQNEHQQSISPPPPEKRSFIVVESPIKLDTISSSEDLDIKVLRIQNKNLSERLLQRQKLEADLREKIDKLQNKKASDDNKMCIIDRYWTQLDEDLRLMLERFDSESGKEACEPIGEKTSKAESTKLSSQMVRNFLSKLNDWDKCEIEDSLKERVKFTTQTVAKLVAVYDRMTKKNELFLKDLRTKIYDCTEPSASSKIESKVKELSEESIRLNELITKCQQNIHKSGLEKKQLEDQLSLLEAEIKDLNHKTDETEYELDKMKDKAFKLDTQLAETLKKLNNLQSNSNISNHIDQDGHVVYHNTFKQNSTNTNRSNSLSDKQLSELETELEHHRELAKNRLDELEKLNQEYNSASKQIEKLKNDLKMIPESVVEQTSEYRMLQTKYSIIVNDNVKLKQALDETRNLLEFSRCSFQRQLEQMESEELAQQKRLGNEIIQIEEQLAQLRKENELLRIEYEQNLAANEQTGPINKEMRSLITTLQTNNKLLKSDNIRTKKRLEEAQQEIEKLKTKNSQLQSQVVQSQSKKDDNCVNKEPSEVPVKTEPEIEVKKENDEKESLIKDLEEKNRRLQESHKDMKNIIDIYTKSSGSSGSSSKDQKKYPNELEEAKQEIKRLKECLEKLKSSSSSSTKLILPTQSIPSNSPSTRYHHKLEHHHHHDESSNPANSSSSSNADNAKKIKSLEDSIKELQKNLNNKKQEEVALLNDMEITGQAFEDMQEQNIRLMQQLREKDDANFKLVSERIKLENAQKILKEEKELYVQQVTTLQDQQEAQMNVSKKLEEQIQVLTQNIAIFEKEIHQLQLACETYKRQAIDNVQLIQELKLNSQKYLFQLKEAQQLIAEKSETLASQTFRIKRTQEEIKHLQAKLERQKKFEMAANMDEVLKEEIKEYKEQLRCPSCKIKQKDAVLTKCFHVFCFDCLQKRYDTRQRKCPKCNAGFGANDFRKLYLS